MLINHTFKIHLVSDSEGAAKRKIRKGSSAKNIYLIKCKNTRFVVFRGNKYIRRSGGILSPKIRWTRVKLLQFYCYRKITFKEEEGYVAEGNPPGKL